jgi:hypothetical protein
VIFPIPPAYFVASGTVGTKSMLSFSILAYQQPPGGARLEQLHAFQKNQRLFFMHSVIDHDAGGDDLVD